MLVLEQEAALKDTVNEIELLIRIEDRPVLTGNSASQFGSEIEVMTPTSEQAMLRNDVTERTLTGASRAEEEDRVYRERVRCIR